MMKLPNYAAEGRIKESCVIAGIRPECLDDVIGRFRDGQITDANLAEKIEEWRGVEGHHFFSATGASLDAEAVAAFGESRTLTAQAAFFQKHGEAAAQEIAERFCTTLGGKPGTTPEHIKQQAKPKGDDVKLPATFGKNPWSAEAWNITRQGSVARALGVEKAQQIAKAAGSFLGATRPPARAA
jgi:hypothetical protein